VLPGVADIGESLLGGALSILGGLVASLIVGYRLARYQHNLTRNLTARSDEQSTKMRHSGLCMSHSPMSSIGSRPSPKP
jgi:hypothetical protein